MEGIAVGHVSDAELDMPRQAELQSARIHRAGGLYNHLDAAGPLGIQASAALDRS